MSQFANAGLLYERYYYYDVRAGRYFNFTESKSDPVALPFFKQKNADLCNTRLNKPALPDNTEGLTEITLETLYPGLVTGLGNTHETGSKGESKLGFFFDYTSGMPVLPGSTVKGVLRSAFPQWEKHTKTDDVLKKTKTRYIWCLLKGEDFETTAYREEMKAWVHEAEECIFEGKEQGKHLPVYKKDIFYDAVITRASEHEPTRNRFLATDSITPHSNPLKNPVPLPFIKILPGVEFTFYFNLKDNALISAAQKKRLFTTLLTTFGIGAKTNVGYGQLEES